MRFGGVAVVILSIGALVSGCAAPAGTPSISRPVFQRPTPLQEQKMIIDGYRKERGCRGRAYARARRYAGRWLDTVVSVPTEPRRVASAVENGRFRIRLAESAARKRCFDAARDTYVGVSEIFTGDPYSDLRQRAERGLNGLPQPSPLPLRLPMVEGQQ